jgi:hypothetical protein
VKPSIWDLLSTILLAASLVLAYGFFRIYQNPDSDLNPFPPPTPAEVILVPSLTPSSIALPDIWTPLPVTETVTLSADQSQLMVESAKLADIQTKTPVLIIPTQSSGMLTQSALTTKKPGGVMLPTKNPLQTTSETDPGSKILTITAPIGVFNNTWQNIQSIPAFSWSTSKSVQDIDHFLLYFGTKQNGKLSIKTVKIQYNHAAVPSGIYYFRLIAVAKDGKIIGSPSSFLFKYDDTPPTAPANLVTASTGETDRPYFTWTESTDAHSGMIGGLAGYAIYQGKTNRCGKPVAFTTVPHWTPVTPVSKDFPEYFCVKALDAIGNESKWAGPFPYILTN